MPFIEIVTHLDTGAYAQQLVNIGNVCELSIVPMKGFPVARLDMASGKQLHYGFKELKDAMEFTKSLGELLKADANARIEIDAAKVETNIYPTKEERDAETMRQILDAEAQVAKY